VAAEDADALLWLLLRLSYRASSSVVAGSVSLALVLLALWCLRVLQLRVVSPRQAAAYNCYHDAIGARCNARRIYL